MTEVRPQLTPRTNEQVSIRGSVSAHVDTINSTRIRLCGRFPQLHLPYLPSWDEVLRWKGAECSHVPHFSVTRTQMTFTGKESVNFSKHWLVRETRPKSKEYEALRVQLHNCRLLTAVHMRLFLSRVSQKLVFQGDCIISCMHGNYPRVVCTISTWNTC